VTSGASVPEELVSQVLDRLAAAGFSAVEEVESVHESLVFALPHELRKPSKLARHLAVAGCGTS
ncbi:MAG TPA: hypothetical protein VF834_03800, partial [Streptosporangiaceae bacterium]